MLLQEFSHQLERRLAVSPWLNQDVQDLAFAVHGTPDVQFLPLMETNTSSRCHSTSGRDRPRLSLAMMAPNFTAQRRDRLVGHVDTTLGEQVLDVAVAESKAEIKPDGVLDNRGWKAVAVI